MGAYGPSVGEPGYVPYCGRCSGLHRMARNEAKQAFECKVCGLETRRVNGEDMFDRTAPEHGGMSACNNPFADAMLAARNTGADQ